MKDKELYFCGNCKNFTPSPVYFYEGDTGSHLLLCPHCGSGSVVQVHTCYLCGKVVGYYPSEEPICPSCVNSLRHRFQKVLADSFTVPEVHALNKIYEGDNF